MLISFYTLWTSIYFNYYFQIIELDPSKHKESSIDWNSKLTTFERMMILKALKEEKVKVATFNYKTILISLDNFSVIVQDLVC